MELQDIRDQVIARRGETANPETAMLNGIIESVYRLCLTYYPWPWLREHGHVRVYPPLTSEFTAVNGNPLFTATAVAALWPDARYVNGWAWSGDRNEMARVIATTVGPPSTFTANFAWLDPGGNFDFSLYRDIYPLTQEVDQVLSLATTHSGTRGYKLIQVHDDEIERLVVNRLYPEASNVMYWSCDGLWEDVDNHVVVPRIRLWPQPDEEFYLPYVYLRRPPALTADTDVPLLPEKHHHVLVTGALEALELDDGASPERLPHRLHRFAQQLELMRQDQPKVRVPSDFRRWDRRTPRTLSPDNWWGQINV